MKSDGSKVPWNPHIYIRSHKYIGYFILKIQKDISHTLSSLSQITSILPTDKSPVMESDINEEKMSVDALNFQVSI